MATTECHFLPLSEYNWGFTRTGPLPWNPTVFCMIATFSGLALYMTLELTLQVYFTFKRRSGLYFWSILITTWGVTLHAIGFILKLLVPGTNWILSNTLAEIGWVGMVTGLSFVLYSRLHLIIRSQRTLRLVLAMIITDAFILHVPTATFQYGLSSSAHDTFVPIMERMERVQVTCFSVQETILSGLYIWATVHLLKDGYNVKMRQVVTMLVLIQVIVILIDVAMIILDFVNLSTPKAVIQSFVYAVKLKLEFTVLNQLVDMVTNGRAPGGISPAPEAEFTPELTAPKATPDHKSFSSAKAWISRPFQHHESNELTPNGFHVMPKIEEANGTRGPHADQNTSDQTLNVHGLSTPEATEVGRDGSDETLRTDNSLPPLGRAHPRNNAPVHYNGYPPNTIGSTTTTTSSESALEMQYLGRSALR
ncbi:MAG: hypothetical protein M4579_006006 [Chaenotheca gracillima]|nr:MAG: hypothetical protein M4579_006006 [Chaenotheca gracillima]